MYTATPTKLALPSKYANIKLLDQAACSVWLCVWCGEAPNLVGDPENESVNDLNKPGESKLPYTSQLVLMNFFGCSSLCFKQIHET